LRRQERKIRSTKAAPRTETNPNDQTGKARNPKSETNSNVQNSNYQNKSGSDLGFGFSSFSWFGFPFVSDFDIRISDLGIFGFGAWDFGFFRRHVGAVNLLNSFC
jgi:hypothetical protein